MVLCHRLGACLKADPGILLGNTLGTSAHEGVNEIVDWRGIWIELRRRLNNGLSSSYREFSILKSESRSVVTLCDPMDYTVRGILQAKILEWVAFPFCRLSSQPRDQTQVLGIVSGFFTNWAIREAQYWLVFYIK